MAEVKRWIQLLFMGLMLVIGAGNAFFMKGQDMIVSRGQFFIHPFFQCISMFIGEFMCLFVYGISVLMKGKDTAQKKSDKPQLNPFLYMVPAACDTIVILLLIIIILIG